MIRDRDIIIVGQQAWDVEIGSNCKDIALEFSKRNRVLYVNPALDRITRLRYANDPKVVKRRRVINKHDSGLVKIKNNLWTYYPDVLIESINWIPIHNLFLFLNKKNSELIASSIKKAIAEVGFKNFILFNDSDIFRSFHLKELLKPSLDIYYSRDNIIATKYWKKHGTRIEPELIKKSALCVANSHYLTNYCKLYNKNSFYVGQGCDFASNQLGSLPSEPNDLENVSHPRIGYVGSLTSLRLSIDLLVHIARAQPQWNIVLVGPQDDEFRRSLLHNLKNVWFLGPKPPAELPLYIEYFDVCINPQAINDLTIGNYPRKIDEYLFMGKPVVATRTEAMKTFANYVLLADDNDEFVRQIGKALILDNKQLAEERNMFALTHSWENSVKEISSHIFHLEEELSKN